MKTLKLMIIAMSPTKNEIELVNLETNLPVYWKLGPALNCRMYKVGEVFEVKGTEIKRLKGG